MEKISSSHQFTRLFTVLLLFTVCCLTVSASAQRSEPLVVNHTTCDITEIPEAAILQAKADLHIAYGRTSHGGQVSEGMFHLTEFANGGGLGLSLPTDMFAVSLDGDPGTLHFNTGNLPMDVGYYPQWVTGTRNYLGPPDPTTGRGTNNPVINVIMWAWCDQVAWKYQDGALQSTYLDPMNQLEIDYPGVTFVYMTGVTIHENDANSKAGNQMIRDFCIANNKVLFDIEDIECYDPNGTHYEFPDDTCDYFASSTGALLGNWGIEYQNSHTLGVDWYDCPSPHSQPIMANRKAYAAWWLWAKLAGWQTPVKNATWGQIKAMFE
jgi:hypothetical protein